MQRNLSIASEFTASREGRYQCSPADPGNWTFGVVGQGMLVGTMCGISAPLMGQWLRDPRLVTAPMMKGLTEADFRAVFSAMFWRALNADALPSGVDLILSDFAFNSGVSRAAKQFQQILGLKDRDVDGDIGVETMEALTDALMHPEGMVGFISADYRERLQHDLGVTEDGVIGPKTLKAIKMQYDGIRVLIYALASRQGAAYRSFRDFPQFGNGWIARLDARLAAALKLLDGAPPSV